MSLEKGIARSLFTIEARFPQVYAAVPIRLNFYPGFSLDRVFHCIDEGSRSVQVEDCIGIMKIHGVFRSSHIELSSCSS